MKTIAKKQTDWMDDIEKLGPSFAKRAMQHDQEGSFVHKNYEDLKQGKFFSAAIPEELGGGGVSLSEICELIRTIAHYCSSTALAFSMHQHLIAAAVYKYRNTGQGAEILQNVAERELVLISTGARDWLGSNGHMEKVSGGYRLSARKFFASQSAGGDMAVTSGPYQDASGTWKVLHFAVPMKADGVSLLDDWKVMGMRATGSQTIVFDNVFVPESAISLSRPQSAFHDVWNVALTVALPLIMAAYLGIAEKAFEITVDKGRKYKRNERHMPYMIGKIYNQLLSAKLQWKAMKELAGNLEFNPSENITTDMLSYKTNVTEASKEVVKQGMEAIGGQSFYKANLLERLFRDVQAASFHPLPEWDQIEFTGKRILDMTERI